MNDNTSNSLSPTGIQTTPNGEASTGTPSVEDDNWSRQGQETSSERGRLSVSTAGILETTEGNIVMESHVRPHADNDDDNWSSQVETDDIQRVPSSVMDEVDHSVSSVALPPASPIATSVNEGLPPPQREEPTLKEKLVERERQRRVETERARLKRQFALWSADGHEESLAEEEEDGEDVDHGNMMRENGSVAGTVGEGSIVAQVDVLLEDDEQKQMNYPMARFLQEQGTILEEEVTREPNLSAKRDPQNQGVVMERFLQEPVMIQTPSQASRDQNELQNHDTTPSVERSVSFDMDSAPSTSVRVPNVHGQSNAQEEAAGESIPEQVSAQPLALPSLDGSHGDHLLNSPMGLVTSAAGSMSLANASMDCVVSDIPQIADLTGSAPNTPVNHTTVEMETSSIRIDMRTTSNEVGQPESPSMDQPRVLGLTQAEIEELAAIDEVSQQNAPPSERDDLSASSFVGELVSGFGPGHDHQTGATTLSQGTPTTAMESASIASGNQSAPPTVSDHPDDHNSFDAMETASVNSQMGTSSAGGGMSVAANPPSEVGHDETPLSPLPDMRGTITGMEPASTDIEELNTNHSNIVNRQIRPGMMNLSQVAGRDSNGQPSRSFRRVMSVPDRMHFDLDGFDYDKDDPASPAHAMRIVPGNEVWSPGSRLSIEGSPTATRLEAKLNENLMQIPNYGAAGSGTKRNGEREAENSERAPLMAPIPDIPSEVNAGPRRSRASILLKNGAFDMATIRQLPDMIFSDIRTEGTYTFIERSNGTKEYFDSDIRSRILENHGAFLLSLLLLEIPIVLMVNGGSDSLCSTVGRRQSYLFLGLLPVSCALLGALAAQSSTSTALSIQYGHLTSQNFLRWLQKEVATSVCIGIGLGCILSIAALVLGGLSLTLGGIVFVANLLSAFIAGLVGCLSPIIFSFLVGSSTGRWHNTVQKGISDIIVTWTMVAMSIKVASIFGSQSPPDSCASGLL